MRSRTSSPLASPLLPLLRSELHAANDRLRAALYRPGAGGRTHVLYCRRRNRLELCAERGERPHRCAAAARAVSARFRLSQDRLPRLHGRDVPHGPIAPAKRGIHGNARAADPCCSRRLGRRGIQEQLTPAVELPRARLALPENLRRRAVPRRQRIERKARRCRRAGRNLHLSFRRAGTLRTRANGSEFDPVDVSLTHRRAARRQHRPGRTDRRRRAAEPRSPTVRRATSTAKSLPPSRRSTKAKAGSSKRTSPIPRSIRAASNPKSKASSTTTKCSRSTATSSGTCR